MYTTLIPFIIVLKRLLYKLLPFLAEKSPECQMFCKKGTRYRAKMAGNLLLNGCLFILLLTICDGGANSGVLAASSRLVLCVNIC